THWKTPAGSTGETGLRNSRAHPPRHRGRADPSDDPLRYNHNRQRFAVVASSRGSGAPEDSDRTAANSELTMIQLLFCRGAWRHAAAFFALAGDPPGPACE